MRAGRPVSNRLRRCGAHLTVFSGHRPQRSHLPEKPNKKRTHRFYNAREFLVKILKLLQGSSVLWLALSCAPPDQLQVEESAQAIIYGEDNRTDVYAHPDQELASWAVESSAALVFARRIDDGIPSDVRLNGRTLAGSPPVGEGLPLCADVRFGQQLAAGQCSATLIAPDLLLTAGHCISDDSCPLMSVVFDFHMVSTSQLQTITSDDLYACSEVIVRKDDGITDHAILRLDRPVVGRSPAQLAPVNDRPSVGDRVIMVGHPNGLPLKIDDNGRVTDASSELFFRASLDAFTGNSGSGVFDASSRMLLGVLSGGPGEDYIVDNARQCVTVNECPEDVCRGEINSYAYQAISELCQTAPIPTLCQGCGDDVCNVAGGENSITCPFDCGTSCGDGACNGDEAPINCESDCGKCGNQVCDSDESTETCCVDCGCSESGTTCVEEVTVVETRYTCLFADGDVCDEAIELSPVSRQVINGTTAGATHTLTPSETCVFPSPAPDMIFRMDLPPNSTLRASLNSAFDPVLYVRQSCDNSVSELTCDNDQDEVELGRPGAYDRDPAITLTNASGTVFLVVDGSTRGEVGSFTMTIEVSSGDDGDADGCRCVTSSTPASNWVSLLFVFSGFALILLWRGVGRELQSNS